MGELLVAAVMIGGIVAAMDRAPTLRRRLARGLGAGVATVSLVLVCVAFGAG